MSKKQSRRDFWRWWREQEEIEKSIKVWPYAGEWFWQAPHRMSGRAKTKHEAMGAAKAALREREESVSHATMAKEWSLMPGGQWRSHAAIRVPGTPAPMIVSLDSLGGVLQELQRHGVRPRWVTGEDLKVTQAEVAQAIEYSAKRMGRCALVMGQAVNAAAGAAARMGTAMEAMGDE